MMSKIGSFIWAIMLFCTFAIINDLMSNEYFVDNFHPQASDSNSGLEESPWLTIQQAADIMQAGDICFVKAGIYDEVVHPQNSGQKGDLITFKAIGAVRVHGFRIIDRTYIRIIGFEITYMNSNLQPEGIFLFGSHGSEIIDNYIHHTKGIGIWQHHKGITNHMLIKSNKMEYVGSIPGREIGDIAIFIFGNYNIVEYNDLSHVADFINAWGENNIIRNNYFHDCYYSDFPDFTQPQGHHVDGLQYYSNANLRLTNTLVESNFFYRISVMHAHIILLRDIYHTGSSELLFRNNVGVKNGSYIGGADPFNNFRLVHNTFVDLLETQSPKSLYCIAFLNGSINGKLINNIFYNSVRDGGGVYNVDTKSENGFYGDYNFAFNSNNPNSTWSAPISNESHGILNQDPQFVNYASDNFHLQHNSSCIGTAGPLTTTVSSGSGLDIRVIDAGYFFDGWGITDGDYIRVGSNDSLKILAIDYDNNIITVNRTVSWNNQDNVNLVYQGAAPDMGAFEYREDENYQFDVKILRPLNGSRVNGIVDIEIEAINEDCIRHVVVFVNGLPEMTLRSRPYKYAWNTDGLPLRNYTIEARAYAYHATANLIQRDTINLTVVDTKIESPSNLRFIK